MNRDARGIPLYDEEKAIGLLETVGEGDGFRRIMACHKSKEGEPTACRGYLARAGWTNLWVRLLLTKGMIEHPDRVSEACAAHGVVLEPDYPTVLAKLLADEVSADGE